MPLSDIQSTVQEVAEAISAVLGVEVTIIDEGFTRVAATGKYEDLIGEKMPSNCIFEMAFKERRPKFVSRTRPDTHCSSCSAHETCTELATIGHPIIQNDEILGLIGINAFKEYQREKLIRNRDSLLVFLDKISSLLAGTLSYYDTIQKLVIQTEETKKIIDSFSHGLLCIDKDNTVKYLNRSAESILKLPREMIENKNFRDIIPDIEINILEKSQQEKKIKTGGDISSVYIKNNPVYLSGKRVSTIMEIHKTADVVRDAYNLLEGIKVVTFDEIIGDSEEIKRVKEIARKVAKSDSTVLLRGESGTGKELFARAIHYESLRYGSPFIAINCASIPDNLLESELFGYEGGAFSGARREGQMGKFELANGGTVFLDEIGDMPLHLQPKILRVLQERQFTRIGGKEIIRVDIRLIAATNKDLEKMIKNGEFREDLYYRLNVIPVLLPALRDRDDDIIKLCEYFLNKYCRLLKVPAKKMSDDLIQVFKSYEWPGNIRELENVIEYMVNITKDDIITIENLPLTMRQKVFAKPHTEQGLSLKKQIENHEEKILISMLEKYGRSTQAKEKIAGMLDINLATLYRKLSKYDLQN